MKKLLNELNAKNSKVRGNVFAAIGNVRASHLFDVALRGSLGVVDAVEASEAAPEVPLAALLRAR